MWELSISTVEDLMIGLSFWLFYFILFKLKKIEIQLNPANNTEEMILSKIVGLVIRARCLYLIFFLTVLVEIFL